jgi:hypothetical protein
MVKRFVTKNHKQLQKHLDVKCKHMDYIDVKSNEQCQWISPCPNIIIKQQVSPSPVL